MIYISIFLKLFEDCKIEAGLSIEACALQCEYVQIELLPSFNFKDVNLGLYLSGYPFNAKWERTTSYVFSSSSSSLTSALKLGT